MSRRPNLATRVSARQVALLLGHTHDDDGEPLSEEAITRWGRRWLQRLEIGRQDKSGGRWYTTVGELLSLEDYGLKAELYRLASVR